AGHCGGLHATGLTVVSLIPPATASYLAYSTAKNPAATYRAARGVVRDTIARIRRKNTQTPEVAVAKESDDSVALANTNRIAEALQEHGYSDWYIALLTAAIEETGDVAEAIDVANSAWEEVGEDPENAPQGDDLWESLGISKSDALQAFGLTGASQAAQNAELWQAFVENFDPSQP